ncbi:MAG TPA: hypothetical protein VFR86_00455 [Burkholderiaceae bacterium]|nr:hypothetical protein [Burkholderiaceae bacterium]
MKYINMHEAAFDSTSVAFPGLGNCHGIVLATQAGLIGYHMAGTNNAERIVAFSMFVDLFPNAVAQALALYGLCPSNRFTPNKDSLHKAELKSVADAIGFTGKIKGYRWDIGKLGWGTTYVEVQFNGGVPTVTIESFTHNGGTNGKNKDPVNHKALSYLSGHTGRTARLTSADPVVTAVNRTGVAQAVQPYTL